MDKKPERPAKRPRRPTREAADAHGDFYFDELMTPQPDATREFFRARLMGAPKLRKPDKDKR